jgi:polar amino acid transport system permease protein
MVSEPTHTGTLKAPRSIRMPIGAPFFVLLGAFLLAGCSSRSQVQFTFNWTVFSDAVLRPDDLIQQGLMLTVAVSIIAQTIGIILGVVAALGRLSRRAPFRWIASIYIWIFRGTPLLVQLALVFFGLGAVHIYDWPSIDFLGVSIPGNIQAGIFALGVNEGAYMAEIVRAGIISIDPGQMEAARSLGMTYGLAMRRVILPQAARVIIPPLGNEFNNMLKTTSLLSVIGVIELYETFALKQGTNFLPFEMYLACALWFLLLTTIWGFIQARIERRYSKGAAGSSGSVRQAGLRTRIFGLQSRPAPIPQAH